MTKKKTQLHKLARSQALKPADTEYDIDYIVEETENAVAGMESKKRWAKTV